MILVTGANGLAGSAVIREFARQHSPVRALVRSRANAQALGALPGVELVEGDMLRPETLAEALSGVDRACCSLPPTSRWWRRSLRSSMPPRAGVRKIVKFSGERVRRFAFSL